MLLSIVVLLAQPAKADERGVADLLLTVRQNDHRLYFRERDVRTDIEDAIRDAGGTFGSCDADAEGTCWFYLSNTVLIGYQFDASRREVKVYGYDDTNPLFRAYSDGRVIDVRNAIRDKLLRRYQSLGATTPTPP